MSTDPRTDYALRAPRLPEPVDDSLADAPIDEEVRLQMYRSLQLLRQWSKRAHDLFLQNLVKGTTHLSLGMEAIATGFGAAMQDGRLLVRHLSRARALAGARDGSRRGARRAAGPGERHPGRQGRLDAPHRRVEGHDGLLRHHRRAPVHRERRGVVGPDARHRPGGGRVLRGRHHEHRGLPRSPQHGEGLEPADRVRLREQPLHGVHADRRRDGGRSSGGRPCRRLRPGAGADRRQRSRRGLPRRGRRAGPRPRRAAARR